MRTGKAPRPETNGPAEDGEEEREGSRPPVEMGDGRLDTEEQIASACEVEASEWGTLIRKGERQ